MGRADEIGRLDFLVVGTARSGTTLVQRLCCELPTVWVPPETHFWSAAEAVSYRFEFPLRGGDRNAMVEALLAELATRSLPVRPARVVEEIVRRDRRTGLWTVFESLVAAMSPPGRMVLGEKTPNHLSWWEPLTTAAPHLKLLAVVRDPRAVLRSHRTVLWGEQNVFVLAERWLQHQRAILDARRLLGEDRVLIIRYEELVADESGHRSRIADFLGVADETSPIPKRLRNEFPLFLERESWKENAWLPATAEHVSAWKGELTDEDVAAVDTACREVMALFGYEAGDRPAPAARDDDSFESVAAFRQWHESAAFLNGLPIY